MFRGVHYFSFSPLKPILWYSLEPPRQGGSNTYLNLCFEQNMKISDFFIVKVLVYLNRRVFVMSYVVCEAVYLP